MKASPLGLTLIFILSNLVVNGAIDKAVHALSPVRGERLNFGLLPLWYSQVDSVIGFCNPPILRSLLGFWGTASGSLFRVAEHRGLPSNVACPTCFALRGIADASVYLPPHIRSCVAAGDSGGTRDAAL